MAPERFAEDFPYSFPVDVYSFGVVLWELATRRVPFEGLELAQVVRAVLVAGERPAPLPSTSGGALTRAVPPRYVRLMKACWAQKPERRPVFPEILEEMEDITAEAECAADTAAQRWLG